MSHSKNWHITACYLIGLLVVGYLLLKTTGIYQILTIMSVFVISGLVSQRAKLTHAELGLQTHHRRAAFVCAAPFIAMTTVVALGAFLINPTIFQDERYQQSLASMVLMVLIIIPLRTVLLEELVFRGVLLGLLRRNLSQNYALISSALFFGLWHIFSAGAMRSSQSDAVSLVSSLAAIAGIVFVTFCAGIVFAWLRITSGSLLAPILLHWAVNSTGVIFAYLSWL